MDSISVDPVFLANRLGLAVDNANFSDNSIAGMITKRGDAVALLVNAADPPFRKRFTIAHELGHHFLHLLEDGVFVDGEADLFRGAIAEVQQGIAPSDAARFRRTCSLRPC